MTWNKFHAEAPQILRSTKILSFTAQHLVARAIWWPGFVHPDAASVIDEFTSVERCWNNSDRGRPEHSKDLSTTDRLGLNPEFRVQRRTTSRLNDGTACSVVIGHAQSAGAWLAQSVQWVGQGVDYRGATVGFPCGGKKSLSSPHRPWRLAWTCSFLSQVLREKAIGAWNKPPQFGANVKNTWSYTFASQCGFLLWSFIFPRKCLGYYTWRCSCNLNQ